MRYLQVGLNASHRIRILTYHLALPFALLRHPSDLVVEDFAPPFGSILPRFAARRPLVAVVQWLFAEEKSRQYRLPFSLFQNMGVRAKKRFVAVAPGIAAKLRTMNPSAAVDVLTNGVDEALIESESADRSGLLFMGRLDVRQKGIDLLLEAYSRISESTTADLTIAGDGPDADAIRRTSCKLGIGHRTHLVGRLTGAAKVRALAQAAVVCMPSRYEALPIVALEAIASATPVVAFGTSDLARALPVGSCRLVAPFDVAAYAKTLLELLDDDAQRKEMGRVGREAARDWGWDAIAVKQEAIYREIANGANARLDEINNVELKVQP